VVEAAAAAVLSVGDDDRPDRRPVPGELDGEFLGRGDDVMVVTIDQRSTPGPTEVFACITPSGRVAFRRKLT
jgi:hypothetical protein